MRSGGGSEVAIGPGLGPTARKAEGWGVLRRRILMCGARVCVCVCVCVCGEREGGREVEREREVEMNFQRGGWWERAKERERVGRCWSGHASAKGAPFFFSPAKGGQCATWSMICTCCCVLKTCTARAGGEKRQEERRETREGRH